VTLEDQAQAIVDRRRAEQLEVRHRALNYIEQLAERLDIVSAVIVGSFARGDFNRWSDVDLLVIAHNLPDDPRSRAELTAAAPKRFEVHPCTVAEYQRARSLNNRMILDAPSGILLFGTLPD
jgi:predicted nucleotidyltransferase